MVDYFIVGFLEIVGFEEWIGNRNYFRFYFCIFIYKLMRRVVLSFFGV